MEHKLLQRLQSVQWEVSRTMTITSPRMAPPIKSEECAAEVNYVKSTSPLLIKWKHSPTPAEMGHSSCMKQVRSPKTLPGSKGCMVCTSQFPFKILTLHDANLPFEGVPKSGFVLTRPITQQVLINHVCFLLNLQLYMTGLTSPEAL